jgi:hypothetical protein
MPATAARDNETLDHLLSVTDLGLTMPELGSVSVGIAPTRFDFGSGMVVYDSEEIGPMSYQAVLATWTVCRK